MQNEHETLKCLGFTAKQAWEALQIFPGNVNEAAAYLLDKYSKAVKAESEPKKYLGVSITAIIPPIFKRLYQMPSTCDVTFYVGEERKVFRAHKYILAVY
jgi:hypothetical protein